jgi:protein-tyrosine phosphatase
VLAGVDDGPADAAEAVALCQLLAASGVREVVASPHVSAAWPTTAAARDGAIVRLRGALDDAGCQLIVHAGGELIVEHAAHWTPDQLAPFAVGDGRVLMIESPFHEWSPRIPLVCARVLAMGYVPLLAHPERCRQVREDPTVLDAALECGALAHVTTMGLAGGFHPDVQACALELVRSGRASAVASDAHDVQRRPPSIEAAWDACVAAGIPAERVVDAFVHAPARILAGDQLAAR